MMPRYVPQSSYHLKLYLLVGQGREEWSRRNGEIGRNFFGGLQEVMAIGSIGSQRGATPVQHSDFAHLSID
jgi:hypothetical protein